MIFGGAMFVAKSSKKKKGQVMMAEHEKLPDILFLERDGERFEMPHQDALVISGFIENYWVRRLCIDHGSAVNIMTLECYKAIGGGAMNLKPCMTPLLGLVFGRPMLMETKAAISIHYLKLKIPTSRGVITVFGNQKTARERYLIGLKGSCEALLVEASLHPTEEGPTKAEPMGELRKFNWDGELEKSVQIGTELLEQITRGIEEVLTEKNHMFISLPSEIVSVDPSIISHQLNVSPSSKHVKQKKRSFTLERLGSKYGISKEANGIWQMCVDFTDLNRACPKDSYPLPNNDQLVDFTSGYEVYSFVNAAQGYHQIKMFKSDEEKTSFATNIGTFCYTVMPFGPKNA
ncbi:uncharacterized protein LOC107262061 [Ricinus communis]|uniref:uncharacterized protein LOC107262061 n=1 Tax=Ricinus communis TaxID=3988 RepID=UPI0007721622|nr:uncharacterized protein LOC107262061 [Ricinus communis]|eukprot:XP_015580961.1 uncharacterized protein LOC107262061 [Ricinus communis]